MTRSWSAGRRREWSRMENTALGSRSIYVPRTESLCLWGVAYLGLDGDVQRGRRGLSAQWSRAEGAREMEEGTVGHGDEAQVRDGWRDRCERSWRAVRRVEAEKMVGLDDIISKSGQVRFASTDHLDLFSGGDFYMRQTAASNLDNTPIVHIEAVSFHGASTRTWWISRAGSWRRNGQRPWRRKRKRRCTRREERRLHSC